MQVMEAIESRRSIRNYLQKPVEAEKLHKVLEAGRKAPSARNRLSFPIVSLVPECSNSAINSAIESASGFAFILVAATHFPS